MQDLLMSPYREVWPAQRAMFVAENAAAAVDVAVAALRAVDLAVRPWQLIRFSVRDRTQFRYGDVIRLRTTSGFETQARVDGGP